MSEPISRIELPHPLQIEAYRRMTPAERLAAGFAATAFVRERLFAHFAHQHPDWTAEQVRQAVARRMLGQPE